MSLLWMIVLTGLVSTSCQRAATCSAPQSSDRLSAEVCIPAGKFRMGHPPLPKPFVEPGVAYAQMPYNDWAPEHEVTLPQFFIDKYEVTWGRYLACVEAGICSTRGLERHPSTATGLRNPDFADRPADRITYDEASLFCAWSGRRLPTEAEWERVARGEEARDYPWGNQPPTEELLKAGISSPVGSHVEDVSVEGAFDLFGNAREWVSDWYGPFYYAESPLSSPAGPPGPVFVEQVHEYGGGTFVGASGGRLIRGYRWNRAGGRAWDVDRLGAPAWFRKPEDATFGGGFRCARDAVSAERPSNLYRTINWRSIAERDGGQL